MVETREREFAAHQARLDAEHRRRMEEVEHRLASRDDIRRAKLSLHNVQAICCPRTRFRRPKKWSICPTRLSRKWWPSGGQTAAGDQRK
jgi:hypothetical protein